MSYITLKNNVYYYISPRGETIIHPNYPPLLLIKPYILKSKCYNLTLEKEEWFRLFDDYLIFTTPLGTTIWEWNKWGRSRTLYTHKFQECKFTGACEEYVKLNFKNYFFDYHEMYESSMAALEEQINQNKLNSEMIQKCQQLCKKLRIDSIDELLAKTDDFSVVKYCELLGEYNKLKNRNKELRTVIKEIRDIVIEYANQY